MELLNCNRPFNNNMKKETSELGPVAAPGLDDALV